MRSKLMFLAAGTLLTLGAAGTGLVHFALSRSVPAADATVTSPAEIRLWFTEAAAAGTVGIRLVDPAGAAVQTTDVVQDEEDAKIYSVGVGRRLAAGRYTVSWRGVGDDGHTVQGDFGFTVSSAQ
jgi:methionine-rich copper-binding protein CopC